MTTTHIVECEAPETWKFKTHHPRTSFFYSYDSALTFIDSKLALGPGIALKHKHIWSVRAVGSRAGEYLHRTAG